MYIILTAKKQFIYQSCYTYQLTRQVCACLRVFCSRLSPLHKWAHQLYRTAHFSYIHTWIYLSSYPFCWDENSSVDPLERKRETNKDKRTTSLSHFLVCIWEWGYRQKSYWILTHSYTYSFFLKTFTSLSPCTCIGLWLWSVLNMLFESRPDIRSWFGAEYFSLKYVRVTYFFFSVSYDQFIVRLLNESIQSDSNRLNGTVQYMNIP